MMYLLGLRICALVAPAVLGVKPGPDPHGAGRRKSIFFFTRIDAWPP
ncbi:hypothetical protein [Desulfomicrobium escambiense]|nr:hypothetical protein [Desulfomicrobium escambiense]